MTTSPMPDHGAVPGCRIHCDGQLLPQDAQLVSVQVHRAFGSVASARLVLKDGEVSTGGWPLADADTFKPGAAVSITAGYDDRMAPLFEGVVTRLGMRSSGDGGGQLVVACSDKAIQMTCARKTATHLQLTDGQLIARLAQANGLAFDVDVDATPVEHATIVQQDCTDWAMVMASAERSGLLVLTQDGQLVARPPQASAAVFALAWGQELLDWCAELDGRHTMSALRPAAGSALGRIRGHMRFRGTGLALPGKLVRVSGVGSRFSGDVFLTAIDHELADGQWSTRAEFGLTDASSRHCPGCGA